MQTRLLTLGAALVLAMTGLSACADDQRDTSGQTTSPSAVAETTTTSNPYGAPPIDPAGPDEPVLAVTGGSTPLSLTMEQLNAMGSTTLTVDEPFVKTRQTFTGVPLAAVLAKAGVPDNATIDTVALNAYHYTSAVHPMITSGGVIATKRDGAAIPYDQGGPIRLVFPDGSPLSTVLDAWNWSLASINVTAPKSGSS